MVAAPRSIYDDTPTRYVQLDRTFPGLRTVCLEPPIFLADPFLSAAQCEGVMAATRAHLVASAVFNGTDDAPRTSWSTELGGEWCAGAAQFLSRPVSPFPQPGAPRS
jgi:hypothetical protein